MVKNNPLSADTLTSLFRTSSKDEFRIVNRESVTIEFKESYSNSSISQYFKAIAAFANNAGGHLIFGVGDKPRRLKGLSGKSLDQFETIKVEEFTKALMDYFSPSIQWDHCTFEFKGLCFGVIYVHPLKKKPCICKKSYDNSNTKYALKEGDIYYRYGGRSERIKYEELAAIIDANRQIEQQQWMALLQKIAKIGVDNTMILNAETGDLSGNGKSIIFDEALLEQIKFIKEGEFVEVKGQPTLRLIGDIQSVSSGKVVFKETEKKVVKAIEPHDITRSFLSSEVVSEPIEYIKRICSLSTANVPLYYYVMLSQLSIVEVLDFVKQIPSRSQGKDKLIERLEGKRIEQNVISDFSTSASEEKRKYKKMWLDEEIDLSTADLNRCVQAFLCLTPEEIQAHENYLKQTFKDIFETLFENANPVVATLIRKAICRLDEILYL